MPACTCCSGGGGSCKCDLSANPQCNVDPGCPCDSTACPCGTTACPCNTSSCPCGTTACPCGTSPCSCQVVCCACSPVNNTLFATVNWTPTGICVFCSPPINITLTWNAPGTGPL